MAETSQRVVRTAPWIVAGIVAASALSSFVSKRARKALRGRVAVVTGGSRGLGFALARQLARAGAKVAIFARDGRELDLAASELIRYGTHVLPIVCDVADEKSVGQAIEEVTRSWGRIDVLINNAGIIQVGPMESMTERDYREVLGVNFWGTLNVSQAVLPRMREARFGRIVNVTSVGGVLPAPHLLPYTCSKFAAVGLSTGMTVELLGTGVRVTTVIPGLMRTGSFLHALFKGNREREVAWFALGSSSPGLTIDAERAASRIVDAAVNGEKWVVLGNPARVGRLLFALAPSLTLTALSVVNRWILPAAPARGSSAERLPAKPGLLYRTRLSRPPFTALGDRAARKYLEASGV